LRCFSDLDAARLRSHVVLTGRTGVTTETLTVRLPEPLQILQLGLGSAVGVTVFAAVMVVAWGYLRLLRREGLAA
jgi:ABC-type sugar transport system permease subunit